MEAPIGTVLLDPHRSLSHPPALSSEQLRRVAHQGCVNRIRLMPQNPHICASWSDSGFVQVWDFSSHLKFLAESETDATRGPTSVANQSPLAAFRHKDEKGYGYGE